MERENVGLTSRHYRSDGLNTLSYFLHTGEKDEHTAALVVGIRDDVSNDLSNELNRRRQFIAAPLKMLLEPGSRADQTD
jgi:hypothetical protein